MPAPAYPSIQARITVAFNERGLRYAEAERSGTAGAKAIREARQSAAASERERDRERRVSRVTKQMHAARAPCINHIKSGAAYIYRRGARPRGAARAEKAPEARLIGERAMTRFVADGTGGGARVIDCRCPATTLLALLAPALMTSLGAAGTGAAGRDNRN